MFYGQTAEYNVWQYLCLTELSCHHNDTHNCGIISIYVQLHFVWYIAGKLICIANMWYFEYKFDYIMWLDVYCQNAQTLVAACVASLNLQCIMIYPASEKI